MYHFLNPRMDNSPYVELLSKKYNCKILTPPDIVDETEEASSMASRKIAENMPLLYNDLEHYWKREHLVKALLTGGKKVDGVLIVSDIWCEMFKEEIPIMINILEEQDIPYYNLVFNVDSLATIDTILESFVETLVYRRNNK